MRLLAVNPNTSAGVTRAFVAEARRIAAPEVRIEGVTGRFGAEIITTEAENLIGAHSALDLVARHAAGHDGVILAISFDTGLVAAGELLPMPVVGITRAAVDAAMTGRRPFGVVIFGEASRPLYARLFAAYRAEPVSWECIEFGSTAEYLAPGIRDEAVLEAIGRLATTGSEAVVICGAAIVGMAARLAPQSAIPLFDGSAAVAACMARVRAREAPRPRPHPVAGSSGLGPELAALIAGSWPPEVIS